MQEVDRGFSLHLVSEVVGEWSTLKDYAYILHDKDETRPHIHLLMRFNVSVPTSAILNKFDGVVEFEHLQKCHSWNGAMAYLTHRNRPNKYQYDDIEVYSNFDWKKDADEALNSDKAKLDVLAEKSPLVSVDRSILMNIVVLTFTPLIGVKLRICFTLIILLLQEKIKEIEIWN